MNGTYPRLAHDQDRAGRIVLMASSALAAFLVLAGLIYATGNSARSAAALAAAGCEPGLSSDSAPCTTRQDLISEYTAAVTPAGRQLDIDAAAYTASEGHHLAQAEAALMSEAAVEHEFAGRLDFPPGAVVYQAIHRQAALRNRHNEIRVIGADGNALVAGHAIEQRQPRAEFFRRRGVLRGGVARIGQHARDIGFGV